MERNANAMAVASPGVSVLLGYRSSATGTTSVEKPWPMAPFTMAATSAKTIRLGSPGRAGSQASMKTAGRPHLKGTGAELADFSKRAL